MTISPERARADCDLLAHYCAMEPWYHSHELRHAVAELCEFVQERTTLVDDGKMVELGTSQGRMVIEMAT